MAEDATRLEELGDLLYERASKHLYDDLINVEIVQLREELGAKGLARSSVFIRSVTELVFQRVVKLKSAFLNSYVTPAKQSDAGITPAVEEWLKSKWNTVWEQELVRAKGVASSLTQTTGYSAAEVHSMVSTVEIRGRELTFDMLRDIKIAVIEGRQRVPAASTLASADIQEVGFIKNGPLRLVIERDYSELQRLDPARTTKSVLVLSGAIIEGLVTDALVELGKWSLEEASRRTLSELLNAALAAHILKHDRLSHAVKDYRNLVHPAREIRNNTAFSTPDAVLAKAAVDIVIREVADWHARRVSSTSGHSAAIGA